MVGNKILTVVAVDTAFCSTDIRHHLRVLFKLSYFVVPLCSISPTIDDCYTIKLEDYDSGEDNFPENCEENDEIFFYLRSSLRADI
jgi:hypothetical protein